MPATPTIINPADHPIRPEMIGREALSVLRKLNRAGFSSYLVGGGVRDLYLGKTPKDFDIGTDARPGQVRRLFPNSRTIGRRFRLVQVFFRNHNIVEVSTLRSLSEHDLDGPAAVLAPNNTYGTLAEDAQRRDLSINALFYEIETHSIIDYVDGVEDLDRRVIRIIGEPDKRIARDPVRMMRVIRHAAGNDFTIDEQSWASVCRNHAKLNLCPPSRLRDELLKDLYSQVSARWFELGVESGLFTDLFAVYRDKLDRETAGGVSCREQLHRIFATIDRLNAKAVAAGVHRQPDYFLLALILVPWATLSFDLLDQRVKGPQRYELGRRIREELNETIGPALNLRRSARQDITTLLSHLPVLISSKQKDSWPRWLKKKGYFQTCRLFYFFYREAFAQVPVPDSCFAAARQPERSPPRPSRKRSKNSPRQGGRPAFADDNDGGIFGFKR